MPKTATAMGVHDSSASGAPNRHAYMHRTKSVDYGIILSGEIDMLVDLNGHTQHGNFDILRRRPAPIQISWLGYAGTTGAPYIDVLIADRIVAPNPEDFTERLEYLPQRRFAHP